MIMKRNPHIDIHIDTSAYKPPGEFERFLNPFIDVRFYLGMEMKDKPFEVLTEVVYQSVYLDFPLVIKAGRRTDFGTIPRPLWGIIPPTGKCAGAYVVHDDLCETHLVDSTTAAKIMREAIRDLQAPRWKEFVVYAGVRIWGPRFDAKMLDPTPFFI